MADKRAIAKALAGSIAKWHAVSEGIMGDNGVKNCPLCALFVEGPSESCAGCPVAEVGQWDCAGGAYEQWAIHHDKKHRSGFPREVKCPTCTRLAKAELRFLEELVDG